METTGSSSEAIVCGGGAALVDHALYTLCGFNWENNERINSVSIARGLSVVVVV